MQRIDEFYYKQPPLKFVDELKTPLFTKKTEGFGKRCVRDGEVSALGCYLDFDFPDPDGILETATADFRRFIKLFEIDGENYAIRVRKGDTPKFESYYIKPSHDACEIISKEVLR